MPLFLISWKFWLGLVVVFVLAFAWRRVDAWRRRRRASRVSRLP